MKVARILSLLCSTLALGQITDAPVPTYHTNGGVTWQLPPKGAPTGAAAGSALASNGTGQPPIHQTKPYIDVRDYGALGNTVNADDIPINAAIAVACASNNPPPVIVPPAPAGNGYKLTKPVHISCSNLNFGGFQGEKSTLLQQGIGGGPLVIVAPSVASGYCAVTGCSGNSLSTATVAGLTRDGGNALNFPTSQGAFYFNPRMDTNQMEFNGLAAFSVEAYINESSCPGGPVYITSSNGKRGQNEAATTAMTFRTGSCVLSGSLNIGGVTKTVSDGGAMSAGTTYFVAMTYDGTTLRLYRGTPSGTCSLVASTAASGTVTQAVTEDVTIGPEIQDWPDDAILSNSIAGTLDSIRFSNVATQTGASFTCPNTKLNRQGSTLGLLNWDNNFDIFTTMHTSGSDTYLALRNNGLSGVTGLSHIELHDLNINSGAAASLFTFYTQSWIYRNIRAGSTGPVGFHFWALPFNGHGSDLIADGGARIGSSLVISSGEIRIDHLFVNGGKYQFVQDNGAVVLTQANFQQDGNNTIGAIFVKGNGQPNGSLIAIEPVCDVESGGTKFQFCLMASGMGTVHVVGGELDSVNTAPVWIDGSIATNNAYTFESTRFGPVSVPASQIKVLTAPASPINLINSFQGGTVTPWTDRAGTVTTVNSPPGLTFSLLGTMPNGILQWCSDCKNVADDTTGTFDSTAASGGHGTNVLRENGAWRVH